MKKWEAPAMAELEISETAHEWSLDLKWDGGYLGDGRVSGWFGGSCGGNSNNNGNDTPSEDTLS